MEKASRFDPARLGPIGSRIYLDKEGQPLRFEPGPDGRRQIWTGPDNISKVLRDAFLAAEDSRFYEHHGLDPAGILRAIKTNILAGRVVSGASTITQQLARLAYPRPRELWPKLVEAVRAIRIEARLTKDEILNAYLNLVPMGNNLVGVSAAAKLYFGLEPDRLSLAQAALLASLPKAPGRFNPYGPEKARLEDRRSWVLSRMAKLKMITSQEAESAGRHPPLIEPRRFAFEAAHAIDYLEARYSTSGPAIVRTTLDLDLQRRVEAILAAHRVRLGYRGASQAAVVILENQGVKIRTLAGSLGYKAKALGYNNGALALRSPGSTLKPFLYGLALDRGFTAASVLEDTARGYRSPQGEYLPVNYDRRVYGPVHFREALGNSLNLSAVRLLNRIGYEPFYKVLLALGLINRTDRGPDHYGLGLVVGNPEVNLLQLATAYACLANGGNHQPATILGNPGNRPQLRVFSEEGVGIITDILTDPAARTLSFGRVRAMYPDFQVALKTGTSTNYRDCWIVGYTPTHTVAIWVGNFNGTPTWNLSGAVAAGPILEEILKELYPLGSPAGFELPENLSRAAICSHSGQKPGPFCTHQRTELFSSGTEPEKLCEYHKSPTQTHLLPTIFAGWLYDRYRSETQGMYRLAGFNQGLDRIFSKSDSPSPNSTTQVSTDAQVIITSPLDGDRFILAGSRPVIPLTAQATGPLPRITWFVDGHQVATAGPPYRTRWRMTPGPHQIAAVGPNGLGHTIQVYVE